MEALGISLGYILAFMLSFGIMFVVLRAWVFKPLLRQLEMRRAAITRGLEDARVAAEARANAERDANRILLEAQARAAEIIREATERADKVEEEIRAQVMKETAEAREAALAELADERNRMLCELRGEIASLAISAAHKIIAVNLDEQRQRQLVNEFFSGICDGRVPLLESDGSRGAQPVDIISALPLTEQEQVMARRDLTERLGYAGRIEFHVDPAILGGLVIRIGDYVVNGSISGQLEELRQSFN